MCYYGEVTWQEFSGADAARHRMNQAARARADVDLIEDSWQKPENALGHEKLLFRERTLTTSLLPPEWFVYESQFLFSGYNSGTVCGSF